MFASWYSFAAVRSARNARRATRIACNPAGTTPLAFTRAQDRQAYPLAHAQPKTATAEPVQLSCHGAEQDFTRLHTLKSGSRLFLSATALTDSRRVGISADVAHVAASTERVVRDDQLVVRVVVRAVPPQHTCDECGPPSVKLWPPLRSTADNRTNPL